jgi:NADH-quinone oxidoreductase subunit M
LNELGGLATKLPLLAVAMVFTSFASIGLPGLNGFVGEFLCLAGMFRAGDGIGVLFSALGALGVVLGAWYLLGVLQHAFFGAVKVPAESHSHDHEPVTDLNAREVVALAPLLTLCLLLGLFPQPLLNLIRPDVQAVASLYEMKAVKATAVVNEPLKHSPSVALGSEVRP